MTSSIFFCIRCTYVMLILCVTGVSGDECCKEYTVRSGRKIDAKWCPSYCCYDTIYRDYMCCEDESKRALSDHREEFCSKWWSAHVYVPVLVGVALFGSLVIACSCICCCGMTSGQSSGLNIASKFRK
ncbi:uncharacterized protein LOC143042448 [Mytilus galloprovincialis]|uniref:uncharacterized protein LOC143042448 n=1 Tax=Mytilus galloprovincialis TaxID=29158 RepID=UPI003F7BCDB1